MHTFIRVSHDWLATEDRYAITYYINGKPHYFSQNAFNMARLCKKFEIITNFCTGPVLKVITWDPETFEDGHITSLIQLVGSWSQSRWIDFITSYEQSIMLGQELINAKAKYQAA